jgi:hypothetical protein
MGCRISLILLPLLRASCGKAPAERADTDQSKAALTAATSSLAKAINARDLNTIMSFYADDATLTSRSPRGLRANVAIQAQENLGLGYPIAPGQSVFSRPKSFAK